MTTTPTLDRVYWVHVIRPQLIVAGNLIETPAMKDEAERIQRMLAADPDLRASIGIPTAPFQPVVPKPPAPAPVRTPAGDWVPASPPVDFKARASGERDDDCGDVPF